jgi:saccharopine dehydrogenase (NAD+, L-glutamate forming)
LPFPSLDPDVVRRSATALARYGPDFTYRHHFAVKHLPVALGLAAGAGGVAALAQIPPIRDRLMSLRKPGDGPSAEQRAAGWFSVHFDGRAGGRRVITRVSGGDPGYGDTAKMIAQSALCLALDDLPSTSGQVTTAAAMGDALVDRLHRAGVTFELLASRP